MFKGSTLGGFQRKIRIPAGSKIVQIGTSLTDNAYQDPSESASTVGPTARGGDSWARVFTNQQFHWVNAGVAGNQIADMIARFSTDVVAEDPDVVIVEAGTNDASKSFTDLTTDLKTLYDLVEANGYQLIPLTIAMRSAGVWSDSIRDKILAVNRWILQTYPTAIDINPYFTDPTTLRPYTLFTDDGTHWTNLGGYAVGKAIAERLTLVGSRTVFGTAVNSNPTLTGTSGTLDAGVSGSAPTGMHIDIEGGHSGTAVATALDPGLQIVFTPGATGSVEGYTIRTNPLDTTVVASTVYEFLAQIDVSEWDGWAYFQLRLYDPGNTSHYDLLQIMDDETYLFPEAALEDLILRTPAFTAVDTGVRLFFEIGVKDDAVGTGTLTMSRFHLQEV